MGVPDPPLSREVLDRARVYVRIDQRVVAALPELGETIRSFKPVPGPAGESVAEWLAERALSEPQEATVRVRLSHGNVVGVYALCAAQVALSGEERAQLGGVHYRTQPAILLAQFARAADTPGIGSELLGHAARTAQQALSYVGATVLVVDPFDEATDAYWQERRGLRPSEQRVPGNRQLRRLWTAIPRDS
ncbi:MAG TPA: hypothetical protein VID29_04265 [Solirubrobacteraceae bacterium]